MLSIEAVSQTHTLCAGRLLRVDLFSCSVVYEYNFLTVSLNVVHICTYCFVRTHYEYDFWFLIVGALFMCTVWVWAFQNIPLNVCSKGNKTMQVVSAIIRCPQPTKLPNENHINWETCTTGSPLVHSQKQNFEFSINHNRMTINVSHYQR